MSDTTEAPRAVAVTPPKMSGRGRTPLHSEEVIAAIATAATNGWTSNGLTYKTRGGADGARQAVKAGIVELTGCGPKDLTTRVWEQEEGAWVFAIAATAAVR